MPKSIRTLSNELTSRIQTITSFKTYLRDADVDTARLNESVAPHEYFQKAIDYLSTSFPHQLLLALKRIRLDFEKSDMPATDTWIEQLSGELEPNLYIRVPNDSTVVFSEPELELLPTQPCQPKGPRSSAEGVALSFAMRDWIQASIDAVESIVQPHSVRVNLDALLQKLHRLDQIAKSSLYPLAPNYRLGGSPQFILHSCLGRGSFASVWRAYREGSPQIFYAVKIMHPWFWAESRREEQLLRGARQNARLRGITAIMPVQQYERGRVDSDGTHSPAFLVMPIAEKGALDAHLASEALSHGQRVEIFIQLVDAMAQVHGRGICHRDLKPKNIVLTADWQPRIVDFDFMQRLEGQVPGSGSEIQTRLPYGDLANAMGAPGDGFRMDQFSLAMIGLSLFLGRVLSYGDYCRRLELIDGLDIDMSIKDALARACEPDLDGRFPSLLQMAKQLKQRDEKGSLSGGRRVAFAIVYDLDRFGDISRNIRRLEEKLAPLGAVFQTLNIHDPHLAFALEIDSVPDHFDPGDRKTWSQSTLGQFFDVFDAFFQRDRSRRIICGVDRGYLRKDGPISKLFQRYTKGIKRDGDSADGVALPRRAHGLLVPPENGCLWAQSSVWWTSYRGSELLTLVPKGDPPGSRRQGDSSIQVANGQPTAHAISLAQVEIERRPSRHRRSHAYFNRVSAPVGLSLSIKLDRGAEWYSYVVLARHQRAKVHVFRPRDPLFGRGQRTTLSIRLGPGRGLHRAFVIRSPNPLPELVHWEGPVPDLMHLMERLQVHGHQRVEGQYLGEFQYLTSGPYEEVHRLKDAFGRNDASTMLSVAQKIIDSQDSEREQRAWAHYFRATAFRIGNEKKQAAEALAQAKVMAEEIDESSLLVSISREALLLETANGRHNPERLRRYQGLFERHLYEVGDSEEACRDLFCIAMQHYRGHHYSQALRRLDASLDMAKQSKLTPVIARILQLKGLIYMDQSRFTSALACQREALRHYTLLDDEENLYRLHEHLSFGYWKVDAFDDARWHSNEAMRLASRLGSIPFRIRATQGLARVAVSSGCFEKAKDHYLELLSHVERSKDSSLYDGICLDFGSMLIQWAQTVESEDTAKLLSAAWDRICALDEGAADIRPDFACDIAYAKARYYALQGDSQAEGYFEFCIQWLERQRAAQIGPGRLTFLKQWNAVFEDWIFYLHQSQAEPWRIFLAIERSRCRAFNEAIGIDLQSACDSLYSARRLLKSVPADKAYLSLYTTSRGTIAFYLSQETIEVTGLDLSSKDFYEKVSDLPNRSGEAFHQALRFINGALNKPLRKWLRASDGKRTLGLILHGVVDQNVLHALLGPLATRFNLRGTRALPYYLPSYLAARHWQTQIPARQPSQCVILTDPMGDLPESRKEGESIAGRLHRPHEGSPLVSGHEALTRVCHLYGSAMTLERLKAFRNAQLIHIATHGVREKATRYLIFALPAPADDPRRHDERYQGANWALLDGEGVDLVDAETIHDLRLSAKLVVLSACSAGRSGAAERGEGEYLLSTAFLRAGCRAVVSTGWQLGDASGAEFMTAFYDQIFEGHSPMEALLEAQKNRIDKFWAPEKVLDSFPDWLCFSLIGTFD